MAGFSMVELTVSMTVLLILTAIAIPSLMRSFRTYQLNDVAARLSDILKFTRFEAVRRNSLEYCQFNNPSAPDWVVWTTSSNSLPEARKFGLLRTQEPGSKSAEAQDQKR